MNAISAILRLIPPSLRNWIAGAALAMGLAERIFWALTRRVAYAVDEPGNVAIALVQGRGFADAYFAGQGPTAHLLPTSPAIAAAAYWLFGIHTPLAEGVLLAWALAMVFGAYLLFAWAAELSGAPPRAVLGGFALLAVVPIYTALEAVDFRVWEGAFGLALGGLLLVTLLRAEADPAGRSGWWPAILAAVTFFVHPTVGLAGVAALLWFLWRRRDWRVAAATLLKSALALALLVGPWTLRNQLAMGEPILLRDNLGLELAVGNFPAMVAPADPNKTFYDRLDAIHPYDHAGPYAAMRAAGGEAAYSRMLGRETLAWMRAHPGDVARIWLRHLREMLFTRSWQFHTEHGTWLPPARSALVAVLAVLALLRLGLAAVRREGTYAYLALFVMIPVLAYLPFQPTQRYTWLIYPALAYLALDLVVLALARLRHRPG